MQGSQTFVSLKSRLESKTGERRRHQAFARQRREAGRKLRSNERQFQGGLVFKARRLLHHLTLGRE